MPLPLLPFDLIAEIVSHLEEEEDAKVPVQIKAGKAISLVCKAWVPLGQALRWRTIEPGPQRVSSLVDHFAHYVHLNNLVRKLRVNTIGEPVHDDIFAQLPGFLSRLINLRSLIVHGAFGRSLSQVLRACSHLRNLVSLEVIVARVEWSNELVLSLREGFTKLSNLFFAIAADQVGDRSQKVTPRYHLIPLQKLVLRLGLQLSDLSSFADDFLSNLDPNTLRQVSLGHSTAIENTVDWLAACPNLVKLGISVLPDEVSLQFPRALLLPSRYSSLKHLVFDVRNHEGKTISTVSPVPLVNVLASFSPSLRWFGAEEIIFPDYAALPCRPAADLDDDDILSLEALYPKDGAEGETGSLLVWGQKEEGRIEWYRDVDGHDGLDTDCEYSLPSSLTET
jgi:hypothetical protein